MIEAADVLCLDRLFREPFSRRFVLLQSVDPNLKGSEQRDLILCSPMTRRQRRQQFKLGQSFMLRQEWVCRQASDEIEPMVAHAPQRCVIALTCQPNIFGRHWRGSPQLAIPPTRENWTALAQNASKVQPAGARTFG